MQNLNGMMIMSKGYYTGYTVYTDNPAGGNNRRSVSTASYAYACTYTGRVIFNGDESECAVPACFDSLIPFSSSFLFMPFSATCYVNCIPVDVWPTTL